MVQVQYTGCISPYPPTKYRSRFVIARYVMLQLIEKVRQPQKQYAKKHNVENVRIVDISSSTERVSHVPTIMGSANTVIAVVRLDRGHIYGHKNKKLVIAVSKGRYE